jgi:hypothetical protein
VIRHQRRVAELAARYGRSVDRTKSGHYRLRKAGLPPVIVSFTPSDLRTIKNTEALLKRMERNKP